MGPGNGVDAEAPGSAPDEEREAPAEGHRVAPRRADGPAMDEVLPLIPAEREHHGG